MPMPKSFMGKLGSNIASTTKMYAKESFISGAITGLGSGYSREGEMNSSAVGSGVLTGLGAIGVTGVGMGAFGTIMDRKMGMPSLKATGRYGKMLGNKAVNSIKSTLGK